MIMVFEITGTHCEASRESGSNPLHHLRKRGRYMSALIITLLVFWVIAIIGVTTLACWAFNKIITAIMKSFD